MRRRKSPAWTDPAAAASRSAGPRPGCRGRRGRAGRASAGNLGGLPVPALGSRTRQPSPSSTGPPAGSAGPARRRASKRARQRDASTAARQAPADAREPGQLAAAARCSDERRAARRGQAGRLKPDGERSHRSARRAPAPAGRAPPSSQSARSGSGCSSSHSKSRRRASSATRPAALEPAREQHVEFLHAAPASPAKPRLGGVAHGQPSPSRMRRLMSAIARAGFRSFGQASVQFMIVWQR